jgi:xylulose-5-phosphate/fructose-6-phosphate phosphoketolase
MATKGAQTEGLHDTGPSDVPHETTLTAQQDKWSVYSGTRSTINEQPLSKDDLDKLTRYFHATLYLCLGMLYLKENPLLKEPLKKEHIKPRLLGHWGSDAGQSFT